MTRSVCAIVLIASALSPTEAWAREPAFRIDIPRGDLTDSLATLALQTGASIGMDSHPSGVTSAAVRGRHSVAQALSLMLAPTRLRAVRIGNGVWRLIPRGRADVARDTDYSPLPDIIVTARKLPEALSRIAAPVAVYVPRRGAGGELGGMHEVAGAIDGMTVTNLGPGRDRAYIRGVSDSPFDGFSQSTVSVNIDEARVTYDAPEPGLPLFDVARVEVLKGPQGPLYGTGALGGVYHIVTNRPVPGAVQGRASMSFSAIGTGGPGADAAAMLNLPLDASHAAIRLVGYGATRSGWIDDAGGTRGVNRLGMLGGRAELRVIPAQGWTSDLTLIRQSIDLADSQYVDSTDDTLIRSNRLPEPSHSDFTLLAGSVSGPVGETRLTLAASNAWQDRRQVYDATPVAAQLGDARGRSYLDARRHRVLDTEVRLESIDNRRITWTVGLAYLAATTDATGTLRDPAGVALLSPFALGRSVTEAAAFADVSTALAPRLRAGVGLRLFRATTNDDRREGEGSEATSRGKIGATPSASLTYSLDDDRSVYLRFGTAFRPGGLDPSNTVTGRYDSDQVSSFDLGTRLAFFGGTVRLTVDLFATWWQHLQSDYLLANGLIATRNAGDAVARGGEAAVVWRRGGWSLEAGVTAQRSRLERAQDGTPLPADYRLPVTPDFAAHASVGRAVRVANRPVMLELAANYVGPSRLSFDPGLDRRMGDYVALRTSASVDLGPLDIRLAIDNLLDTRADSFAFGNPFRIRLEQQSTPVQPRTISLGLSRHF